MKKISETIHLPKTGFQMRANLFENELKWLDFWQKNRTLDQINKANKDCEKFIIHDGPPYANGNLHLGHALNKILKDIIRRSHQKLGYNVHFIPGWDCHGLPIEWKVEEKYRKKGENKGDIDQIRFRKECRQFAEHWINIQCDEFKRLGLDCDWEKKYTTMKRDSETTIVSELLKFLEQGSLYLGHKPVMWSVVEKTALAEAEVEYKEKKSTSIFVKFKVHKSKNENLLNSSIIIWTTTPWTLPGNRAIAFSDKIEYQLIQINENYPKYSLKKGEKIIFSKKLKLDLFERLDIKEFEILKNLSYRDFEDSFCKHPLKDIGFDFDVPLLFGAHVTNDFGSGFVHIAPGHGIEDFAIGKNNNIPVPKTVNNNGVYNKEIPYFAGMHIFKADKQVIEKLQEFENIIVFEDFNHSFPHSWRSQAPLIYRTTSQWFISMSKNNLRNSAIEAIEKVKWIPSSSKNRILSMVSERPDWCISRQRSWGVPITIFINKETSEPIIDRDLNKRIISLIDSKGVDFWFHGDKKVFLGEKYDDSKYEKVTDILDVWFDSGASHVFVLKNNGIREKADLYLEGSDQHRGWFQSSLIESTAIYGDSPYKSVLTHGFVLDEKGKKMSKSEGNVISPEDVIKKFGADVLRLWVATSNYKEDLRISFESLERQSEIYRKIRNSLRFLLGNLKGWQNSEKVEHDKLPPLERYIRHELFNINKIVIKSFKDFDFYKAFKIIANFCNNELSSLFFDIRKDILYCEEQNSYSRRSSRTVMIDIFNCLISWLSPVLAFTAEEAWQFWRKEISNESEESCHMLRFSDLPDNWNDELINNQWTILKKLKNLVTSAIEKKRELKVIKSNLETSVSLYVEDKDFLIAIKKIDLRELFITSEVEIVKEKNKDFISMEDIENVAVSISSFDGVKCQRCWKLFKKSSMKEELCKRCYPLCRV